MNKFLNLSKTEFHIQNASIVPLRDQDKYLIMKWRNDQMYHLRQSDKLTSKQQDRYFTEIISKMFIDPNPDQMLFSYFFNSEFVGYGGIVHINWLDKNAEISFLMNTDLEKIYFETHWSNFLSLIEVVAFEDLKLHKLYTFAFDLRPQLYNVLEKNNYSFEARLIQHVHFNGKYIDAVIHSKINE